MWDVSGALTEEDLAQGFSLEEDEDVLLVLRHGELLVTFSSSGATRESLREFLDREKGRPGPAPCPPPGPPAGPGGLQAPEFPRPPR